jgi:low molecular weight protein-tyrosine phosphatase
MKFGLAPTMRQMRGTAAHSAHSRQMRNPLSERRPVSSPAMRPNGSGQDVEIVFVCTGNRARSPLAEALLRRRVAGLPVRVVSRGTSSAAPATVLPEMVHAADMFGVDLRGHVARRLVSGELADAALVIGFEPHHVATAVVDGRASTNVAFTLPELLGLLGPTGEHDDDHAAQLRDAVRHAHGRRAGTNRLRAPSIVDPVGEPQAVFDRVATEIAELVDRLAVLALGIPSGVSTTSLSE